MQHPQTACECVCHPSSLRQRFQFQERLHRPVLPWQSLQRDGGYVCDDLKMCEFTIIAILLLDWFIDCLLSWFSWFIVGGQDGGSGALTGAAGAKFCSCCCGCCCCESLYPTLHNAGTFWGSKIYNLKKGRFATTSNSSITFLFSPQSDWEVCGWTTS